jgi:hypothetical protein
MTNGAPFFRGLDPRDGYAGALALARLFQLDYPGVVEALSSVEPCRFLDSFVSAPQIPAACVLKGTNVFFILIVGTQNNTQLALDVVGSSQIPLAPFPGLVGAYWAFASGSLWGWVRPIIASGFPGSKLVIMGHSLGGAIGMCLYHLAMRDLPSGFAVQVTTFGASKPGDPGFAAVGGGSMFRWEDTLDPVPALPPPFWNPIGAFWPLSGPPPLAEWSIPGQAATIDSDGTITVGSSPPNTVTAAALLARGEIEPHLITEYARRLHIKLTPAELSPPESGFVHPEILQPILSFLLGETPMGISVPRSTPDQPLKVYVAYTYGTQGISEEFFCTSNPTQIQQTVLRNYLYPRMRMAVDKFKFNYARISNPAKPRQVDFITPDTPGIPRQGAIPTGGAGGALGAPDTSALLLRMKLASGPSARIFLHGYDGTQDNQGTFTPNSTFDAGLLNFIAELQAAADGIFYQYAATPPVFSSMITSVTPKFPRGATIVPQTPVTFPAGTTLNFANIGSQMQGLAGRKIVTNVAPGGNAFDIGGASPVGSYLAPNAYFYTVSPLYAKVSYAYVERITEHKVGRPFGDYPGRKKNRIPLRR